MRRLLIGAVLASASALWPFSSSEKQDPPTPHPDAVPVAQQTALPRLSNYDAVDEAFAEGGALVDEGGIVLDVDTASQAAAGFVGGQEWPSYVAATDVEPAAFVLKGINWSDQAPESVVKAARVASQALEKRKEALTKSLAKKPGLSHLEKRTSKPRIFGEVHVALHEASSKTKRCFAVGEGDRDVDGVALTAVSAVSLSGSSVRVSSMGSKSQQWRSAELSPTDVFIEGGAPLPILTNGRLQAATHKLVTEESNDILTVAVLWYMDGDLEPVNTVEWQTTDGPITKIDKYGPPAYPSNLQECSTLEARSLRIRARLNGDFGSAYVGHATRPCDYDTFDDFLEMACEKASAETIGRSDLAGDATGSPLSKADEATCLAADGARAFDARGNRLRTIDDLLRLARSQPGVVGYPAHFITNDNSWDSRAAADVWVVPSTVHFVWPTVRTGHVTRTELRDEITGADAGHASVITTLSMRPQVFRISQFMLEHECEAIIERNKPRIKPSEVGLVGRAGDRTRTSTNAWDTSSPTARDVIGRAFRLLKIDAQRKLEDGLQVLHYDKTQWYKPHVDYFTQRNAGGGGADEDAFSNAVPIERNGTNRFATVFLYLNDAAKGGETVFPLSDTHATYQGGRLTTPGTNRTVGFIRDSDAAWVCNGESEALRVVPRTGDSVLFYSQRGDASLDGYSLHGSCPMIEGEKWAANLWVWNRPRDEIDRAKSKARGSNGLSVVFKNTGSDEVELFWADGSDLALQGKIAPGQSVDVNTYASHRFVAKAKGVDLGSYVMKRGMDPVVRIGG
jgi:prolyl 4-hydroxylase